MPTLSTVAVFVLAAFGLIVIPGPAVLYIVAWGIHQGRLAALVSALGVELGALVHVVAAALGLSALLLSSAVAFSVVKWAGAAYLVYLGIRTLLTRETTTRTTAMVPKTLPRIFVQGFLVNLLNPKVALFFFAFLPQFVDPTRGTVAGQTLLLGGLFVAVAVCSDGVYALLAGSLGGWLRGNLRFLRAQRWVTGTVYLALGATTALTRSEKK
jgi:threonine/homoserine/homoserine lactone efflux protein